jgi:hypothetical protein
MTEISLRAATEREVIALQSLVLIGLGRCLEIDQDGAALPDLDGLAGVAALLVEAADQTPLRKKAVARWSGRFHVTEPPTWTVTQAEWIAVDTLVPWWRRLHASLVARMARLLGRSPPDFRAVAPCLLDPVVRQAWGCPVFRRAVARMIHAYVRARVIMWPGGGGVPELAMPTLWAVTAFALETVSDVNDHKKAVLRARLRRTATSALETEQWAGFWDVYVLARVRALWADAPGPVVALDLAPPTPLPEYLRGNWRDSVPGFAPHLINHTRIQLASAT